MSRGRDRGKMLSCPETNLTCPSLVGILLADPSLHSSPQRDESAVDEFCFPAGVRNWKFSGNRTSPAVNKPRYPRAYALSPLHCIIVVILHPPQNGPPPAVVSIFLRALGVVGLLNFTSLT